MDHPVQSEVLFQWIRLILRITAYGKFDPEHQVTSNRLDPRESRDYTLLN